MNTDKISKYDYHYYVFFVFLLLSISAFIAIFTLDFTPTYSTKIYALTLAILSYLVILSYFYRLYRHGEWVIPRTWKNAQKRPMFYFLVVLPLFAISIFYVNLVFYPPLLHTITLGTPTVIQAKAAVKKQSKKGGVYYSIQTPYDSTGIFRITADEYEHYKNQNLLIKLSVIKGRFGTYIQDIQSIHTEPNTNK